MCTLHVRVRAVCRARGRHEQQQQQMRSHIRVVAQRKWKWKWSRSVGSEAARCLRPAGRRVYGDIERGSGRSAAQRSVAWRERGEGEGEGERRLASRLVSSRNSGVPRRGVARRALGTLLSPRGASSSPGHAETKSSRTAGAHAGTFATNVHVQYTLYEYTPRIPVPLVMHYELLLDSTRLQKLRRRSASETRFSDALYFLRRT